MADINDAYFPSAMTGTIIDVASVKVLIGGKPKVLYHAAFAVHSLISDNSVIKFTDITTSDIKVGDTVKLTRTDTSVLVHTARIVSVDAVNNLATMNMACLTDVDGVTLTVAIYRPIPTFTIGTGETGVRTVASTDGLSTVTYSGGYIDVDVNAYSFDMTAIFVLVDAKYCPLADCKIYTGYRARNTGVNKVIELHSQADLAREIGVVRLDNPLGFAANLAFANMTRIPVKVFGTVDDTLASWNDAKDKITIDTEIYSVIPLTQDPAILAIFKDHCVAMSDPEVSAPRICIGSAVIDTDDINTSGVIIAEGSGTLAENSDGVLCILTDADAEFISSGAAVGDEIRLYDADGVPYSFEIGLVPAENMLKIPAATPFEVNGGENVTTTADSPTGECDGYSAADVADLVITGDSLVVGSGDDGVSDAFVLVSDVAVPADVTITEAHLNLALKDAIDGTVLVEIFGVKGSADATPPTTKAGIAAYTLTTATVEWSITTGAAGAVLSSPDIKTIIAELNAEASWRYTGSMIFMIKDNSSVEGNTATFCSVEYNGGVAKPALSVTYTPVTFAASDVMDYRIVHTLTSAEKAIRYKALSASLATSTRANMVNIWPTSCKVSGYTDTLPGYYMACCIGGQIGQLPSQQSLTKASLSGISSLGNIGYFNNEQLNTIASGGTFIVTQANESAVPIIRHQLTTNMTTIEFKELSFVKNFDWVALALKRSLDGFVGVYNITARNLGILGTVLKANLESMKADQQAVIGAPIIDYNIVSITQLEAQRDRVEIYVEILFPYVMNYIGLHIVSQ
jgi:hypothetical protein